MGVVETKGRDCFSAILMWLKATKRKGICGLRLHCEQLSSAFHLSPFAPDHLPEYPGSEPAEIDAAGLREALDKTPEPVLESGSSRQRTSCLICSTATPRRRSSPRSHASRPFSRSLLPSRRRCDIPFPADRAEVLAWQVLANRIRRGLPRLDLRRWCADGSDRRGVCE